ncbi:nuclear pore complex protein NUP98B-like [Actinidia eriantha]|uniref:nuclear pore complex protein NUP98B-like n=1 Tax=Actinidia eriantha TaxID=165200 RepID=UPI002589B04B|nr:nuclear pore complex protein NUP98B-like [Actinidia eriantha]
MLRGYSESSGTSTGEYGVTRVSSPQNSSWTFGVSYPTSGTSVSGFGSSVTPTFSNFSSACAGFGPSTSGMLGSSSTFGAAILKNSPVPCYLVVLVVVHLKWVRHPAKILPERLDQLPIFSVLTICASSSASGSSLPNYIASSTPIFVSSSSSSTASFGQSSSAQYDSKTTSGQANNPNSNASTSELVDTSSTYTVLKWDSKVNGTRAGEIGETLAYPIQNYTLASGLHYVNVAFRRHVNHHALRVHLEFLKQFNLLHWEIQCLPLVPPQLQCSSIWSSHAPPAFGSAEALHATDLVLQAIVCLVLQVDFHLVLGVRISQAFRNTEDGDGKHAGSRVLAYTATTASNGCNCPSEKLVSISAMPAYINRSPEELRWEDYQQANKGIGFNDSTFVFSGFRGLSGPHFTSSPNVDHTAKTLSTTPIFPSFRGFNAPSIGSSPSIVNNSLARANVALEQTPASGQSIIVCAPAPLIGIGQNPCNSFALGKHLLLSPLLSPIRFLYCDFGQTPARNLKKMVTVHGIQSISGVPVENTYSQHSSLPTCTVYFPPCQTVWFT